jgi:predicted RNase H-like HicB family nuclease
MEAPPKGPCGKITKREERMFRAAAYIERDPETGMYVAVVPGVPGAHTQAETLDELQRNLKEVL